MKRDVAHVDEVRYFLLFGMAWRRAISRTHNNSDHSSLLLCVFERSRAVTHANDPKTPGEDVWNDQGVASLPTN
jgi:hypothetical protein